MKKNYKLTVRANKDEYEIIKLKAELLGISMSRLMIDKAKNCYVEGYAKAKEEKKKNEIVQIDGQMEM